MLVLFSQIVIHIGLQAKTYMPSCVSGLFFVLITSGYMAHFTDSCSCCFIVFFSSVKRLHDRKFCAPECHFGLTFAFVEYMHFSSGENVQHNYFSESLETFS